MHQGLHLIPACRTLMAWKLEMESEYFLFSVITRYFFPYSLHFLCLAIIALMDNGCLKTGVLWLRDAGMLALLCFFLFQG